MDVIPYLDNHEKLNILDLGCGIGRNCIPIAQAYREKVKIDCVDILEFAIEKLLQYSKEYDVAESINGIVSNIEEYRIERSKYNLIMAVSSLEHVYNEKIFYSKLMEIKNGVVKDGIVCLLINSNVKEEDKETHTKLDPQFEVNLSTEELKKQLNEVFGQWKVLKYTEVEQRYDIPRDEGIAILSTTVVTMVVQNILMQ